MSELVTSTFREHPLIFASLGLLFLLIQIHGVLEFCRIFLRVVIVVVREVKHQLSGLGGALRDLVRELRSWKSDP